MEGWVDGDAGRVGALDSDSWSRWEENTAGVARPRRWRPVSWVVGVIMLGISRRGVLS